MSPRIPRRTPQGRTAAIGCLTLLGWLWAGSAGASVAPFTATLEIDNRLIDRTSNVNFVRTGTAFRSGIPQ